MKIFHRFIFLLLTQLIFCCSALAFESFVVSDIKIIGLEKVSKEAVLEAVDIQPGQTFTQSKTPKVIRSLFSTGFFKNVQLEKERNVLVIKVAERPIITEFELKGVRGKEKILKTLRNYNIAKGRMYNPSSLTKAQEELEIHYLSSGKYGVRVEAFVKELSENTVSVKVDIFTGDEARIKQIKIVGNHYFSEKELLSQLHHSKTSIFSWFNKKDQYAKEKLAADLDILRSYYMDRGFVNFVINSTQVSLTPDKKGLYININVTENKKYNFGKVDVSGDYFVKKEELLRIISENIQEGKHFSRRQLWDAKTAIEERLGEEGYSKADVRFNFDTNEDKNIININFFIEPNKRVYVRRINILGNTLTEDIVLRRKLVQDEGTWVSTADVKKGKNSILRNGYAADVEVETASVPNSDDQVDITYKIEEQRTAQLSAGLTWSQLDKFAIDAGASFKNFCGTGKDLSFNFNKSKEYTNYSFDYFDPYFTESGVGFGYGMYYSKRDFSRSSDEIFDYSNRTFGGRLRWSYPVTEYSSISFGLGYDHNSIGYDPDSKYAPLEASIFFENEGTKFDEYSLFTGWTRSTLDRYVFPSSGTHQVLNLKISLPCSDLKYYNMSHSFGWYVPIYEKDYVFHFSTNIAYGNKYSSTCTYPFFKNYHLGGAESVRGYRERSLGPLDSRLQRFGGNLMMHGTIEIIFPPPFFPDSKSVRTSLFLDAGQAYTTINKTTLHHRVEQSRNPTGIRYSVGICLKWHSPLGVPMTFAFAKPLNDKSNDRKRNFHFTFGASLF